MYSGQEVYAHTLKFFDAARHALHFRAILAVVHFAAFFEGFSDDFSLLQIVLPHGFGKKQLVVYFVGSQEGEHLGSPAAVQTAHEFFLPLASVNFSRKKPKSSPLHIKKLTPKPVFIEI